MSNDVVVALIGGVAGLFSGGGAGWLTSTCNWRIEKSRLVQDRRRKLIDDAITGAKALRFDEGKALEGNGNPEFALPSRRTWFQILKAEMSQTYLEAIEELEKTPIKDRRPGEATDITLEEIGRIEESWELR